MGSWLIALGKSFLGERQLYKISPTAEICIRMLHVQRKHSPEQSLLLSLECSMKTMGAVKHSPGPDHTTQVPRAQLSLTLTNNSSSSRCIHYLIS